LRGPPGATWKVWPWICMGWCIVVVLAKMIRTRWPCFDAL